MSDAQPAGFKGFLWAVAAVWLGAAGIALAGWLFPSMDDFFMRSGKMLSSVWEFLTATVSVPALPLGLGVVLLVGTLMRQWVHISLLERPQGPKPAARVFSKGLAPTLTPVNKFGFDVCEIEILSALLHSSNAFETIDADVVINTSRHPRMVMNAAAEKLLQRELIEVASPNPRQFKFTPAGKALAMENWRAVADGRL